MTQKMIDEIAVALNQGLYLVALSAALTLPDVCGKAEYPEERVSTRYKKWYSTFVPDGNLPEDSVYDDLEVRTLSYLANREIYGDFTLEQLLSELQERYIYTQKTADECRKGNYKSLISIIQSNCFVISNLNNERLIRQSGAFLLCGQCNITLNQSDPGKSVIQKASGSVVSEFEEGVFRIPADQKEAILEELDFYNINEGALFPELEHQMTYIKKLQSNKVAASV